MLLLLAGAQDSDRVSAAMAQSRDLTHASTRCRTPKGDDEITVCARRDADRYRIPPTPAPRDSVPDRVARLTEDHGRERCGQGAFTVHCGKVGAGVSVSFGRGAGSGGTRVTTDHVPEQ